MSPNPAQAVVDQLAAIAVFGTVTLVKEGAGGIENLFFGLLRPVGNAVPSQAVFCAGTRGPKPEPYLGINQDFDRFQVEVLVRSNPGDYPGGEQLARDVMHQLQRTTPGGYICALLQQAGPELRGESDEREFLFGFAVELWFKG